MAQALEAPANASVCAVRSDLQDDPADEIRVDGASRLHRAARGFLDRLHDRLRLVVAELIRRRELHGQTVLRMRDEGVKFLAELRNLARPALLRREPDKVAG